MIRTLLGLIPRENRGTAQAFGVLTVLSVLLRAAGVVLLVPLVSALFGAEPADAWPWLGALTAVTVLSWGVDTVVSRLGFTLGFALLDRVQHQVADRITEIRLDWFTAEHTATARQAIAATGPDLVGLVVNLLTPMISATLLPVAIAVALLPISWPLALAAAAGVPVLLGALTAAGRITRRADRVAEASNVELAERIIEFARTQPALRAARRVEPERSHAGAALVAQHGAMVRLLTLQVPGQILFGLASQLALVVLAGTVTALTVTGSLTVPAAIACIVVIVRFLEPFTTLGELAPALEPIRTTLDRIEQVLRAPTTPAGTAALTAATAPRIEFQDVTFGYHEQVLRGLTFTLEPGGITAIVGPSGSGKSTILSLIAGLLQPTGGRILVDGIDLSTLTAQDRRALTSVVFQDPFLFDGSVVDNVRAGDPAASDIEVARAIELARADSIAAAGDRVGESGRALSGGERQRVSIARALLKPAPVLLVDEATSALDSENERAIGAALAWGAGRRTTVVVAHRLASISSADRVLFLDEGRIVQDGTVEGLLAAEGRFRTFWQQQLDSAGWQLATPH